MKNRIKELREKNNLTLDQLGKLFGMQKAGVQKIQQRDPLSLAVEDIVTLGRIFKCHPWEVVSDEPPTSAKTSEAEGALREQVNGMMSIIKALVLSSVSKHPVSPDQLLQILTNLEAGYRREDRHQAASAVNDIQVFAKDALHGTKLPKAEQLLTRAPAGSA